MDTQKLIENSKSILGLAAFDRELKHSKSNGNVNARIKGGKMYKIIANNCKKAGTICGISFLFQALFNVSIRVEEEASLKSPRMQK